MRVEGKGFEGRRIWSLRSVTPKSWRIEDLDMSFLGSWADGLGCRFWI